MVQASVPGPRNTQSAWQLDLLVDFVIAYPVIPEATIKYHDDLGLDRWVQLQLILKDCAHSRALLAAVARYDNDTDILGPGCA